MIVFGVQIGQGSVGQHDSPLYRKMTEPAADGIHGGFQTFALLLSSRIVQKRQLHIIGGDHITGADAYTA